MSQVCERARQVAVHAALLQRVRRVAARQDTLWRFVFSEPFRWLTGKAGKLEGWSIFKMSSVLELAEKAMEEIEEDPSLLFNPTLDIFKPIADVTPEFADWRAEQLERVVVAEDGSKHFILRLALA